MLTRVIVRRRTRTPRWTASVPKGSRARIDVSCARASPQSAFLVAIRNPMGTAAEASSSIVLKTVTDISKDQKGMRPLFALCANVSIQKGGER
ncbi:hypothetical protein [Microbacterium sp. NIBRBAC000506063]|uniref:hypothetical protein n=1 Tax=Microbacterium sp. NIBRBAC000506063 TaxID=2734618 RepID=UPI001BB668E6|nr:hypothetical protein [Microbacterium sp. NIBRBAC000506063]QTV80948.1 hypothetical protein KAE78_14465 [Microbacterium sp. NIBRBAC000506063]